VTVASLVGGCAFGAATTSTGPSPSIGLGPPPTPPASAGPSGGAGPSDEAGTVELTEDDHGQVVTMPVGTTVRVVLHSTYWSAAMSSNQAILAPVGTPAVSPAPPGTCLPGVGCGTVTSIFVARAAGQAGLTAGRTVCGEARACSGDDGHWFVVVKVRA
jgi:hypothetical protein